MITAWKDLASLAPEGIVALGALFVLFLDLGERKERRRLVAGTAAAVVVAALAAVALAITRGVGAEPQRLFSGILVRDLYALLFDGVFLLSALLAILLSVRHGEREEIPAGELYALLLFSLLGMMLLAASAELITLFISYEVLSVAVYVLAGLARKRAESAEAALKYFLLGAFSSGFLVYGIALVYGATSTTFLAAIASRVSGYGLLGNALLLGGLALILIGIGFKAAVAPFHAWVPDVYQGAPLPVTAFMSAAVKAAAFAAAMRVLFAGFSDLASIWQPVLWVLAAVTMLVGNAAAIPQTNLKRMLAYSSIAHAGYVLAGVAAYAAGSEAVGSVLYYSLVYAAMVIGAFAILVMVGRDTEERQELEDYRGLAQRHPWSAAAMTLFLISLAGLPPTAGFIGKLFILLALIRARLDGLAVLLVLASVISLYYYLRVVRYMYMEAPAASGAEGKQEALSRSLSLRVAVLMAVALVVLLGLFPTAALTLAQTAGITLTEGGIPILRGG